MVYHSTIWSPHRTGPIRLYIPASELLIIYGASVCVPLGEGNVVDPGPTYREARTQILGLMERRLVRV